MNAIKNNKGSAVPFLLTLIFLILGIIAIIIQTGMLSAVAFTVRSAMEQTARAAITENSENTYASKRESYAGAYTVTGADNTQILNTKAYLQEILQLTDEGTALVKRDTSGKELYRLEDIRLTLDNPPHKDSRTPLNATVTLTLIQPAKFGFATGDVPLNLKVVAYNSNKFN